MQDCCRSANPRCAHRVAAATSAPSDWRPLEPGPAGSFWTAATGRHSLQQGTGWSTHRCTVSLDGSTPWCRRSSSVGSTARLSAATSPTTRTTRSGCRATTIWLRSRPILLAASPWPARLLVVMAVGCLFAGLLPTHSPVVHLIEAAALVLPPPPLAQGCAPNRATASLPPAPGPSTLARSTPAGTIPTVGTRWPITLLKHLMLIKLFTHCFKKGCWYRW